MADEKKSPAEEEVPFEIREKIDDIVYHLELYSEVMTNNRGGLSEKCVNHIGNALGNLYEQLRAL